MARYAIMIGALLLCIPNVTEIQAQSEDKVVVNNKVGSPTIIVTKLEINDKALKLLYEIRNDSEDDAWILVGCGELNMSTTVFITEDGQTLTIAERRDLHISRPSTMIPTYGRYVRLRPGESQIESIFIKIPVHSECRTELSRQQEQVPEYATRLAIELGYYQGNLPEKILRTLKPRENIFPKDTFSYSTSPDNFSGWNERLISRDEELLIPTEFSEFEGEEQILWTVVDNLHIPYEEKQYILVRTKPPDLTSCTKVEFQYQPSMLEYFFPYFSQQRLLSPDENKYLLAENIFVVEDTQELKAIANDFSKASAIAGGVMVRYRNYVDMVCYYNGKPPISFPIYNDDIMVLEGERLHHSEGFPSLRMLTPQVQAISLRMRCAANLKNQWYRLRFYNIPEAIRQNDPSIRNETIYPTPTEWCDAMLRPYPALGGIATGKWNEKPHVCPSAGEGKNHYAMNPNCEPDSPGDMVLMFETKAGWNQHGGPELFTFDNHDPKGGCVLLNDGTVKFIRTKEELQQLRWK